MRILVVDTYYPEFLQTYALNSACQGRRFAKYSDRWRDLMDQCFGTADFYSWNLERLGHQATDVVANFKQLQLAWASENGVSVGYGLRWSGYHGIPLLRPFRKWQWPVLLAQVKQYRPDAVHFQDPVGTPRWFLELARPHVGLIVGQIASQIPPGVDFAGFDLMLTSFPHFVERFRSQGVEAEYFRLGFEPRVLGQLSKVKTSDVVFVGGISDAHSERTRLLETVAEESSLEWWGYGVETLDESSPLRSRYRGPAWGLDMYNRIRCARICLNHHIGVAENYANNMRLYEATGVGSCLVTDLKDNLGDMFELGREVMTYSSHRECVDVVSYLLQHEGERRMIAEAGQKRTLTQHTYGQRMAEYVDILRTHLL